ncbi:hypothetical protein [Paenibacillus ferrarius]|uniref:hypothetical protein n=1 Tax=Paenibacillus ferrarius TaxID=1469647 RepID=UPI001301C588|nr:hypothetical protein [Paenibacillus ferrarius]
MSKELFIDVGSPHETGTYNVIKQAWDEIAGWHWTFVDSFETEEEANKFISESE